MSQQLQIMRGVRISAQRPLRVVDVPVLTAQPISDSEIRLDWVFNDALDADKIEIERSDDGLAGWANIATPSAGSIFYINTGLSPAAQKFYRARGRIDSAIQGVLLSEYSPIVSATTTNTTPGLVQPTGLTFVETSRTNTSVTYAGSWNAVTGAVSYDWWIEPGTVGGFSSGSSGSPNNVGATGIVVVIPRLSADDLGTLQVRASNASGVGPPAAFPFTVPGNLKAPTLVSVNLVGGDSAEISYAQNADAVTATGYQIERNSLGAGFLLLVEKAPGLVQPQHTDPTLPAGTHLYRVRARADEVVDRFSPNSATLGVTIAGPPPSGAVAGQDFLPLTDISQLAAGFNGGQLGGPNVFIDPGQGVAVRFPALPLRCGDQSIGFFLNFAGWPTVWVEYDFVFPTNWTTSNPNCSSPQPDYKHLFFIPKPGPPPGSRYRADFKTGVGGSGNAIAFISTGYPAYTSAPSGGAPTHVSTPVNAIELRDGLPHRYRYRYSFYEEGGAIKEIMQSSIDDQLMFSYKDFGNPAFVGLGSTVKQLKLGSNRNLGAVEEMITHWRNIWVYATNQGWFAGVGIKDYADLGGAEYFE